MTKIAPKFKVGDLLLVTKTKTDHRLTANHPKDGDLVTVSVVSEYYSDGDRVYFFKECSHGRFESELELSELSKSPLWKALE